MTLVLVHIFYTHNKFVFFSNLLVCEFQGRELFYRVIRMGFEDIYLSSPGSFYEKYGEEYFICTGPASMLVPVVVKPGEDWRGAQVIEHDNL